MPSLEHDAVEVVEVVAVVVVVVVAESIAFIDWTPASQSEIES